MAQQLIVVVFDSIDVARRAYHDFEAISEKDEGFDIESSVVVQKGADGKLTVESTGAASFDASIVGAITHSLLGMLGEASETLSHSTPSDLLDNAFVESISSQLAPGRVATVLEAQEQTPFAVDNVVTGLKGKVLRHPVG